MRGGCWGTWLIMLGFMDLGWPRVCRRSTSVLLCLLSMILPSKITQWASSIRKGDQKSVCSTSLVRPWSSYQIRKIAGCACAGNVFPASDFKGNSYLATQHASRHVRHARTVMHVGIANPRWRGISRRMRIPHFYVSGKRPVEHWLMVCADTIFEQFLNTFYIKVQLNDKSARSLLHTTLISTHFLTCKPLWESNHNYCWGYIIFLLFSFVHAIIAVVSTHSATLSGLLQWAEIKFSKILVDTEVTMNKRKYIPGST